jgi:hypothetical protein
MGKDTNEKKDQAMNNIKVKKFAICYNKKFFTECALRN